MRSVLALPLLILLLAAPQLEAQRCDCSDERDRRRPTGGYAGASALFARPQGEFRDHVDQGWGGRAHYIHRLDRDGVFGIRADGGFVSYGHERQRVLLSPTVGGRILMDLTTTNNIGFVGVGPQLGVPDGRLRPYVNGFVGVSYLFTESSLRDTDRYEDQQIGSTTNYDDHTFGYGGGAGVYIPVRRGVSPISIDLGVTYHDNGRASYLTEGGIQDNDDGSITLFLEESDTDLLSFHVGVSVGLSRDRHRGVGRDRGRRRGRW